MKLGTNQSDSVGHKVRIVVGQGAIGDTHCREKNVNKILLCKVALYRRVLES